MRSLDLYNQDGIRVSYSVQKDVDYLKTRLRKDDIVEIWASNHLTPREALQKSLNESFISLTIHNGSPIAMFGVNGHSILGEKACIWMLGSDDLEKIKIRFLKNNHNFINYFLGYYPYLYNHVDDRNKKSIKWLKFLGAKIDEPKPYGKDGKDFRYFMFKRNK